MDEKLLKSSFQWFKCQVVWSSLQRGMVILVDRGQLKGCCLEFYFYYIFYYEFLESSQMFRLYKKLYSVILEARKIQECLIVRKLILSILSFLTDDGCRFGARIWYCGSRCSKSAWIWCVRWGLWL
jgi:hypothetical protein